MILDKALILKGLGGLTALGGTAAAAYFGISSLGGDSADKELKKDLGLPEDDSDCKLPTSNNSSTTCTLDTNKLKAIKFDGKGNGEITIENNGTASVTLTITKVDSTDSIFGKGGYKFAFESNKDITISSTSPAKYIKKNTNTEFKIKETTPTDGGAKTLSLEKAWSALDLAKKVGITSCESNNKECTFQENAILNVSSSNSSDKREGTKISDNTKKLKYEEDQGGYNQGFKFTTEEDINLTEGTTTGTEISKIEKKSDTGSPSYEIKEIGGKWYLAKKTTNGVNG